MLKDAQFALTQKEVNRGNTKFNNRGQRERWSPHDYNP